MSSPKNDMAERLLDLYEEAKARVAQLRADLEDAERATAGLHQALVAMGVAAVSDSRELRGNRLREELHTLLREIDPDQQGVHYRELTQRLMDRGHAISGQGKENNVRAHMANSPMFKQLGRGIMTWAEVSASESGEA